MQGFKSLHFAMLTLGSLCLNSAYAASTTLHRLSDTEMSATTGQALLSMSYIAPSDTKNLESQRTDGDPNLGFYRLGMEAELELNANIKKLQLGCGGANGAGGCDIDIDHLSLSGVSDTRDGRAGSSAKLTNPFIEFAIQNPNQASTRNVVGLRLSAEKVLGLLSLGTENSTTPNGINSLSGYMKVRSGIGDTEIEQSKVKGYANTAAQYMSLATYPIEGRLIANVLVDLADADFKTNGGGFSIPEMNNLPFENPQIVVNGKRNSSIGLNATVNIPTINLGTGSDYPASGRTTTDANGTTTAVYTAGNPVDAVITGCRNLTLAPTCLVAWEGRQFSNIKMSGSVNGAKATVNFQEALGFIHRLEINSAASLSLQKQNILWPDSDAANIAQSGWWLALQDPVSIGRVEPTQRLSIEPLLGQFATKAGDYLKQNPARTNDLLGVMTGNGLDVDIGNLDLSNVAALQMNLSNLQLNGQNFAPNCYGSLSFC
ncbi:hypothetical protein F895_00820 [Acinetobacter sp. CIP 64.2]|uniref:hypothetical protein n=1 Tax=Acinetobacter sp. CIP 64.2 TaxID=1217694 RepID=UPI00028A1D6C|nr:hypothetical protein [Acinetobacter sp. CIP 64.2]ENX17676.1 hypothetical protein F895_00820 [Acinetobacter sp. CIP 64.2]